MQRPKQPWSNIVVSKRQAEYAWSTHHHVRLRDKSATSSAANRASHTSHIDSLGFVRVRFKMWTDTTIHRTYCADLIRHYWSTSCSLHYFTCFTANLCYTYHYHIYVCDSLIQYR